MKTLVVLAVLFLVAVYAHEHEKTKNKGHHNAGMNNSICHYRSTKGVQYDLRLLDHQAVTDLQYFDSATSTTFYFRPCSTVTSYHQHGESCPAGSSVCMVSANGKAVNFGTNKVVQWADGVEDNASIEAAYGNGETCNNGAARKTFVEYVCNLQKVDASNSIVSVTMIDDCTAKFVIESAFACPVANYCASIHTDETCENQLNLCKWSGSKCEAVSGCLGWRHLAHASGLAAIVLITSAGVLFACTFGLCLCACKRRRRNRAALCKRKSITRKSRSSRKSTPKKVVKKEENVEYAPFQMPFQLIPGGFAPINPYSNIQGYPMVNLSAPNVDESEQV